MNRGARAGAVGHHCSRCGQDTGIDFASDEHRLCVCGHTDHVNPAPCVGVAIVDAGKILLAKRGVEPKKGQWDLVGGFVESGEDAETAARREVGEETGMIVRAISLMKDAPGRYGTEPTLNLVFLAQADGEPKAADDVAELQWFALEGLPELAWPHEAEFLQHMAEEWKRIQGEMPATG